MRTQRYGIEIEMTGITRAKAATVIAHFLNTSATHIGGSYDTYTVRMTDGRQWKIVSDASISPVDSRGDCASRDYKVEIVSPILQYEDMETLQELVRQLRHAGAKVNESCGIHIHVDASAHNEKTLRNLVNIMAAKEDLLYKALGIHVRRESYCKKTDYGFLRNINHKKPRSMEDLERLWYGGSSGRYTHYHDSRYHALNLHAVFSKGTIEFRLFNSTLHAGEIKSYVQLCLAISHQALVQKAASHLRTTSTNEKYTFRTWLLRLGMIGKEFETARLHLLKNLNGNIAWKSSEQAEAQRLRLAQRAGFIPSETEDETALTEEETPTTTIYPPQ